MKLDLGCGPKCKEGFTGVDIAPEVKPDVVLDLVYENWPWKPNSVEHIFTSHFIEHIPMETVEVRRDGRYVMKDLLVLFFERCWTCLKPDGLLEIVAPAVTHETAFGDPTHRRFITNWTWRYFNKEWRDQGGLTHYGIDCDFVTLEIVQHIDTRWQERPDRDMGMGHYWNVVAEHHVKMKAVKQIGCLGPYPTP